MAVLGGLEIQWLTMLGCLKGSTCCKLLVLPRWQLVFNQGTKRPSSYPGSPFTQSSFHHWKRFYAVLGLIKMTWQPSKKLALHLLLTNIGDVRSSLTYRNVTKGHGWQRIWVAQQAQVDQGLRVNQDSRVMIDVARAKV